jgi:hypothetical protein
LQAVASIFTSTCPRRGDGKKRWTTLNPSTSSAK